MNDTRSYCVRSDRILSTVLFKSSNSINDINVNVIMKKGKITIPVKRVKKPRSGGMNVEPVYAPAICTPIIAREFSSPKLNGVECIMDG